MGVYFPLDICEGISAHVLSSGFLGDTYKKGKKIEICIFHYIIFPLSTWGGGMIKCLWWGPDALPGYLPEKTYWKKFNFFSFEFFVLLCLDVNAYVMELLIKGFQMYKTVMKIKY